MLRTRNMSNANQDPIASVAFLVLVLMKEEQNASINILYHFLSDGHAKSSSQKVIMVVGGVSVGVTCRRGRPDRFSTYHSAMAPSTPLA